MILLCVKGVKNSAAAPNSFSFRRSFLFRKKKGTGQAVQFLNKAMNELNVFIFSKL
jgi:hypothetical protein